MKTQISKEERVTEVSTLASTLQSAAARLQAAASKGHWGEVASIASNLSRDCERLSYNAMCIVNGEDK